jgi:hypothetical protein
MLLMPKIYADFHKTDKDGRLILICIGTRRDLQRQGIELSEGMKLIFYCDDADDRGRPDDLIVQGRVEYDAQAGHWVGVIDWNEIRHESDLTK